MRWGELKKKCVSCASHGAIIYPKAFAEESAEVTDFHLFFFKFLVCQSRRKAHCSYYPLHELLHDIKGENPCFLTEKALQGEKTECLKIHRQN